MASQKIYVYIHIGRLKKVVLVGLDVSYRPDRSYSMVHEIEILDLSISGQEYFELHKVKSIKCRLDHSYFHVCLHPRKLVQDDSAHLPVEFEAGITSYQNATDCIS